MKYEVGDKVRIVSEAPKKNWVDEMDVYLGRVMTIKSVLTRDYKMVEDEGKWFWDDGVIVDLASETPFDFSAWKDKNVCMHCKTRNEAEDFCNEMHKAGLTWSSGNSYLSWSCFEPYKEQTCYCFNKGTYDSTVYAKDKGYQILEWSDYRSTEPKEEQEKIMKTKLNDKPLSYQEAMEIRKRLCLSMRDVCGNCPLSLNNNGMTLHCDDFMMDHPDMAEPILKEWLAEHPVKTNRDKFIEVFGSKLVFKDDSCGGLCDSIDEVPCGSCNWWWQEYVEPYEEKE